MDSLHVEAGELEEENILKVNTIQNWINTYARVSKKELQNMIWLMSAK
jgi:hypothetical protein